MKDITIIIKDRKHVNSRNNTKPKRSDLKENLEKRNVKDNIYINNSPNNPSDNPYNIDIEVNKPKLPNIPQKR